MLHSKKLPNVLVALVMFVSLWGVFLLPQNSRKTQAATGPCYVALSIDVSGSIDNAGFEKFKAQIKNSFNVLNRPDVQIAFWTFSNLSDPGTSNFNSPFSSYVPLVPSSVNDSSAPFAAALNNIRNLGGLTNYAQGFGYNPVRQSPGTDNFTYTQNSNESIKVIARPSSSRTVPDLMILLTDGEPNQPTSYYPYTDATDMNTAAVNAAKGAIAQYIPKKPDGTPDLNNPNNPPTKFAAGYISEAATAPQTIQNLKSIIPQSGSQYFVGNVAGPLSLTNNTVSNFINNGIRSTCGENAPPPPATYTLLPVSAADKTTVGNGTNESVEFTHSVTKSGPATGLSAWRVFDLVIPPTVTDLARRTAIQSSERDGINPDYCTSIRSLFLPTDRTGISCYPKETSPISPIPTFGVSTTTVIKPSRSMSGIPLGSYYCSVLILENPVTDRAIINRISRAACVKVTETKLPLMQVWGGDVRSGLRFENDGYTLTVNDGGIYTSRLKVADGGGTTRKVFGSWGEYGVMALKPIQYMASLSGYKGGYSTSSLTNCDPKINRLTFTNVTPGGCGNLSGYGIPSIPDVIKSVISISDNYTQYPLNTISTLPDRGRYIPSSGSNITIDSDITLRQSKTYVIYAPNGTVTINKNISYQSGPYNSVSEIPQLIIIAKNIDIASSVSNIDAWLIAKPVSGNGGVIKTCSPFSVNACLNPLRVNGAVMANELRLQRTKTGPDCILNGSNECTNTNAHDVAAETINLSGASLMWTQESGRSTGIQVQTTYTTELPPYY